MRILFVHNAMRSFVKVDRDILSSAHQVDELDLSVPLRVATLPSRLARADLVFAWFASLHSFFPVIGASLLHRPSIVVVGGYDTANMPDIGYGHIAHPVKRHVVRLICRSATALVANSWAAAEEVKQNVRVRTPIHVLYHGFELQSQKPSSDRAPLAVTVGNVSHESMQRKGHEVFVRSAAMVPYARFVLVGRCLDEAGERLRDMAPPNVQITGFLSQPDLDALLDDASVYVQASAHEGFGCALAEAMARGCIPVVSRQGALPEVVGEYGVFVDPADVSSVATGIRRALAQGSDLRPAIAERIATCFSFERRRHDLLALVKKIGRANGM